MQLDTADVVIVGGGLIGFSTAYALRRRGFDVVLLEQRFAAFGASGRNSGGLWVQTAAAGPGLDLVRAGIAFSEELTADLGDDCGFLRSGGVFFFETDEQERALKQYVIDRHAAGIHAEVITAAAARELSPLVPDLAIGAVYSGDDARLDTARLTRALAERCRRDGVRVYENTAALELLNGTSAPTGVRTVRGDVSAGGVVLATGAWLEGLAPRGFDIPIRPVRMGMLVTQPARGGTDVLVHGPRGIAAASALREGPHAAAFPVASSADGGLTYDDVMVQQEDGRIVVGHSYDWAESLNPHISLDATKLMTDNVLERRPDFGKLGVVGLWAGLMATTADELPVIDRIDGLFLSAGYSTSSPAGPLAGELIAQLVAGETPVLPLDAFAADRDYTRRPQPVPAEQP